MKQANNSTLKPGAFTSEFWLAALTIIAITVLLVTDSISTTDASSLLSLAGVSGLYSLSRGMAKQPV